MSAATGSLRRLPICVSVVALALALTAAATGADLPASSVNKNGPADSGGAVAPAVQTAQDQSAPATPDANKAATQDANKPPTPDANKPAAAPAVPEATPPPPPGAPPKNLQPIFPGDATSILGKKVQGAAGEDMGRVVDILVDGEGQPRAAVIDFGGFLGVGSRKIAVDWRLLQFRPTDRKAPIQLSVTRGEVQAAPEYKEKNEPTQVVGPPTEAPAAPDAAK
jgi:hypothetical protein